MGMGNPLLDISAEVNQSILEKYDVKLDSAILADEKHLPIYKELIEDHNASFIAGGSTQNSIRIAQWILRGCGRESASVFMGCIGSDYYGKILETCASNDGVTTHYMKDSLPTGTCAVLVKGGERSLIANLAAANNFKKSHLETSESKVIYERARFFYIAGFFLTVSMESLVLVAEHSLAMDKIFCLNLSAPFIIEYYGEQVQTALPYVDYLFCNESEAHTYAKKHEFGPNLKDVALQVAASYKKNKNRPRTVVFTQGPKSTIVAYNGVVTEYPVVPLDKELLVDTNGAGDAFVGGFLSMLVQGKTIKECVNAGHWAAKYIIQQSGTTIDRPCTYKESKTDICEKSNNAPDTNTHNNQVLNNY